MLNVFITIDTEIWCGGWNDIDQKFPASFKQYIYGPTKQGNYGLPIILEILADHDLTGIFFVESLFSLRFNIEPLHEIVSLIGNKAQEIQLHIHPEWVDEAKHPFLANLTKKRPYLFDYSYTEQCEIIKVGLEQLALAGVTGISAFRAGSYAANRNTLKALRANNICIDTSYNYASAVGVSDLAQNTILTQHYEDEGVSEYPVTIFKDFGPNIYRPLQLTACSSNEFEYVLNQANELNWESVVIVLHNFELLTEDKARVDKIVLQRFLKLCKFLADNKDRFNVRGMHDLKALSSNIQATPIVSNYLRTGQRMLEQKLRNFI